MRVVMFYHSLVSDWNHGNAHFLRGVVGELLARGHRVEVYEPERGWSVRNLVAEHGAQPLHDFQRAYPQLASRAYDPAALDLDRALDGADLVLVHEWNEHGLVARIGAHRAQRGGYVLLFHDTHHRAVTEPGSMAAYDLRHYDGVLAFGRVLRDLYLARGWAQRAWTWHEAADVRVFYPRTTDQRPTTTDHRPMTSEYQPQGEHEVRPYAPRAARLIASSPRAAHTDGGDLVWVGNWGDDERTAELREFLLAPVRALGLRARVHGVRYPAAAQAELAAAGIEYAGWLPNYRAPEVFARFRVTVHVMRRPYTQALPGIPTIRVFEALACGIPLVCSPWDDAEELFTPGADFLVARDGAQMQRHLATILRDADAAHALAAHGLRTIRQRHTCAHRVDELLAVYREVTGDAVTR